MCFVVLEIESFEPQSEYGVYDRGGVLCVNGDDFFLGKSLFDAVYVGGGVEAVTLYDIRGADFGYAVEYGFEEVELVTAQTVYRFLKAYGVCVK